MALWVGIGVINMDVDADMDGKKASQVYGREEDEDSAIVLERKSKYPRHSWTMGFIS